MANADSHAERGVMGFSCAYGLDTAEAEQEAQSLLEISKSGIVRKSAIQNNSSLPEPKRWDHF